MSQINSPKELLAQIKELEKQISVLKNRKKYGLVWEDKPEDVVLQCIENVPVLKEVKNRKIVTDNLEPSNLLIEGDNYHALSVLNYTHKGKIDVIYIDPPYNTGATTWRYNNDYVDKDDSYRHSKFLSFIKNRIDLAKNLLKEDGYFICAIDHNELFTLGLMFDDIFGEDNRLGLVTVLHNPKGRNFTKYFSANSEYMLVYSKNNKFAEFNDVAIDEEVMATFDKQDSDGKRYRLEPFMRCRTETLRINKPDFFYPIYTDKELKNISLTPIKGGITLLPLSNDGREFSWINLPETFQEKSSNRDDFVIEYVDGRYQLFRKFYESQIYKNVWTNKKYFSEFNGTNLVKDILGDKIFDYPKSLYLLEDILKIISSKNALVVDFFAGSGTTGHAVLELNKQDNGARKFILCTNNENKICEEVTYERIKRVIKGYTNRKGEKVEGLGGNLSYYKTDLVNIEKLHKVSDEARIKVTYQAGEMIAVREDTLDEAEKNEWWQIFTGNGKITAIYFKENKERLQELINILEKKNMKTVLYIFGWGKNEYRNEYSTKHIKVEDIPEPILEVYKEINRL
jgi:adenine-specific DNA-methyltransferase